jgi:hypothetical protein
MIGWAVPYHKKATTTKDAKIHLFIIIAITS